MIVEVPNVEMGARHHTDGYHAAPNISIGMYCRVELPAEPLVDALLIPRQAIQDDRSVYVFEPESDADPKGAGRLERREVTLLRTVGDSALVGFSGLAPGETCELEPGDILVTSSLIEPIAGMRVMVQKGRNTAIAGREESDISPLKRLADQSLEGIRATTQNPRISVSVDPAPGRHVASTIDRLTPGTLELFDLAYSSRNFAAELAHRHAHSRSQTLIAGLPRWHCNP
jgi:hypothetical protein